MFFLPLCFSVPFLFAQGERIPISMPAARNLALVSVDGEPSASLRISHHAVSLPGGQRLLFPGDSSLWTVVDFDGDGAGELLVLANGESLLRLCGRAQSATVPCSWEVIFEGIGARRGLPRGHRPATFLRDLDQDGFLDMMVPAAEDVLLFFGTGDDNSVFRIGPRLSGAATLSLVAGDPFQDGMLQQVTRRVSVPPLQMKDFSGDSHPDLLISRGNVLLQYIANEQGALPSSPTATVDLALFEAKLSSIKFDPGNLAALAQFQIQESWVDLNLDGADDLLVLFGGTLVVYRGGPQGIDLRRPMDQIPTRGNVLGAFALPVDADEIPDLVLLRVEEISLGRVLSWLLLDVSVDFDLLVYRGRGNCRFDKRPLPQSRTIEIQAPSLLVLANRKEELDEKRRGVVRLADFDGDGKKTDLVVLDHQGKLEGYSKVASKVRMSNMADDFLLQLLAKDAPETLDLEMLSRWILGKTSLLESLSQGNRPVFSLDPPKGWQLPHLLAVADFDGDGAEECLVLRRKDQRFVGYQYDPQLGGIPK